MKKHFTIGLLLSTFFAYIPTLAADELEAASNQKMLLSPAQMTKMEKENRSVAPHFAPVGTTIRELEMCAEDPCWCINGDPAPPRDRLYEYVKNQKLTYNGQNIYSIEGYAVGKAMEEQFLSNQRKNIEKRLDENEKRAHVLCFPAGALSLCSCTLASFFAGGYVGLPVVATSLCATSVLCAGCCAHNSELPYSEKWSYGE